MSFSRKLPLKALQALHADVDADVRRLRIIHSDRLRCRAGCNECCLDGLTVFEIEAQLIRSHHGELLATGSPCAPGACAFLGAEGECRIYDSRPYVCRTQGLPLRWLEENEAGEIVEDRDICHRNVTSARLEQLEDTQLWTLGPVELRLLALQDAFDGGLGRRCALRDLFDHSAK